MSCRSGTWRTWVAVGLLTSILPVAAARLDPASGLIIAPGWQAVRANCGACHSFRLITSQRGDATFWRSIIRWMQRTQNLWDLEPARESEIIDYLSTQYVESDWGRRPPLSVTQLPPTATAQ